MFSAHADDRLSRLELRRLSDGPRYRDFANAVSGQRAAFLAIRYVEASYALLITMLIGMGIAAVIGALGNLVT